VNDHRGWLDFAIDRRLRRQAVATVVEQDIGNLTISITVSGIDLERVQIGLMTLTGQASRPLIQ
jgi:hypothetical protein